MRYVATMDEATDDTVGFIDWLFDELADVNKEIEAFEGYHLQCVQRGEVEAHDNRALLLADIKKYYEFVNY